MIRHLFASLFTLILMVCFIQRANATHLRAGEIIVKRVDCSSTEFEITIIVYTDSEPSNPVLFGGLEASELRFGDESSDDQVFRFPEIQNNTAVFYNPNNPDDPYEVTPIGEDLPPGVSKASFTIRHTFSSQGRYIISYREANRNAGILNIESGNSINTTFYIETEIRIDGFLGCNNTPQMLIPPIDKGCTSVAFFHNPGAFDPDGDSIAFELVVPKKNVGTTVANYISPADFSFYNNPAQGNEDGDGPPVFEIDPVTGEITWDAPGTVGEYNIAFIVKEYRFFESEGWVPLGFVTRDMQIIVEDCDNDRPELEVPMDICVEAGERVEATITGFDPNGDDVQIEAFSQVINDFGATVSPDPPQFVTSPGELTFIWDTECLAIRDQPYKVDFKISDNPPNGPKLVSFATWFITVVGPSPEVTNLTQDGQGLLLTWNDYFCKNAEEIEVWRRVDSNPYTPDECETGIRENAGYNLIGTVAPDATAYRDDKLAAAAKYCYRLVASFPEIPGGESIVSDEICFEFVPAEEPIITHVTVESTSTNEGEVLVAWRAPFELGTFPSTQIYRVYRAQGFSGGNYTRVTEIDGTGLDSIAYRDIGLNTENDVYNYRIALVDPSASTGEEEITSAPASAVRLQTTPQFGQIKLDWNAVVPWSNVIVNPPNSEHLVYRGLEGQSQDQFVLLGALDVTRFGFSFTDSSDLSNDQVYCYRVLTKGTYGNPDITTPLLNFSQIACAQPSDSIPPCAPVVTLGGFTCEEFIASADCGFNDFENELFWETEFTDLCEDDIAYYEVYFAPTTASDYIFLAKTSATTFIHEALTSFKGCYKVRAVDRSGNEGEFSNEFCVDNCPYYELPNVFTPGNGDNCNDTFVAYGADLDGDCGVVDNAKCARFVERVKFTVYNRWGRAVYTYDGVNGQENGIYIHWDGRSDDGGAMPAGVYYYLAEVTFDVVNPEDAVQQLKGWIHLLK